MADPVIEKIVGDIKEVEKLIKTSEEYIAMMKEAGEDYATLETDLRTNKLRLDRWKKMLVARGYYK